MRHAKITVTAFAASASTSGATSSALSIVHSRSDKSFARASPNTGPTSPRNFAIRPSSSSGTRREPQASSAWRTNLPFGVVTVTRAGRSRG